ncbi:GNAT family protein [Flaviaesturariibacter amylovorans]|uniref:N-acetyltransferase domain-containing protein n=1 Tax=Flaviaesturariibacter amylovorans TaxID=1084520 RepID=A0ABP8GAV5_9BACT
MLSVRELRTEDIPLIVAYWFGCTPEQMAAMGADAAKLPTREQLAAGLAGQLALPVEQRRAYALIWELDGVPVGHCNTNPTTFGEEAFMHLHLWTGSDRHRGLGRKFVLLSLPYFFNTLQLQRLYSEPYALNPAPNRTLEKAGFRLEKEYVTTPGSLNFEQPVKRWVITKDEWEASTSSA